MTYRYLLLNYLGSIIAGTLATAISFTIKLYADYYSCLVLGSLNLHLTNSGFRHVTSCTLALPAISGLARVDIGRRLLLLIVAVEGFRVLEYFLRRGPLGAARGPGPSICLMILLSVNNVAPNLGFAGLYLPMVKSGNSSD